MTAATAPARAEQGTRPITEHARRRLSAPADLRATARAMPADRLSAARALRRWMRLTSALIHAQIEGDRDRERRIRRIRRTAAAAAERRYRAITPATAGALGNLYADPSAWRRAERRDQLAHAA